MTLKRWILIGAAVVCLVVAAFAAMTAREAGEWQRAFRTGDIEAASTARNASPTWSVSELAPFGLARRILGVDDDLAFRRSVALFRRAHTGVPSFDTGLEGTALRVQAEAALAHEIRDDTNPARAAAAENLLGILVVIDSTVPGASTPIERAIFQFEDAIH